jgi:hypothetical protein
VTPDGFAELAGGFPEAVEGVRYGNRTWTVAGCGFAWERPLTKADVKRYGEATPPDGPIVALRVDDLNEKEAVLAAGHDGVFDIAHFNGYPAVLVQLRAVRKRVLRELMTDAWLACAPERLAEAFVDRRRGH